MEKFMDKIRDMLGGTAGNIVGALLVLIVGFFVIKAVMKALRKLKSFEKLDQTTTRFILNFINCTIHECDVMYFLIASKLSSLMSCSILQASSTAVFSSTPRRMNHCDRTWWRS